MGSSKDTKFASHLVAAVISLLVCASMAFINWGDMSNLSVIAIISAVLGFTWGVSYSVSLYLLNKKPSSSTVTY